MARMLSGYETNILGVERFSLGRSCFDMMSPIGLLMNINFSC